MCPVCEHSGVHGPGRARLPSTPPSWIRLLDTHTKWLIPPAFLSYFLTSKIKKQKQTMLNKPKIIPPRHKK